MPRTICVLPDLFSQKYCEVMTAIILILQWGNWTESWGSDGLPNPHWTRNVETCLGRYLLRFCPSWLGICLCYEWALCHIPLLPLKYSYYISHQLCNCKEEFIGMLNFWQKVVYRQCPWLLSLYEASVTTRIKNYRLRRHSLKQQTFETEHLQMRG